MSKAKTIIILEVQDRFFEQIQTIPDCANQRAGSSQKNRAKKSSKAFDVPVRSASDDDLFDYETHVPPQGGCLIPPKIFRAMRRVGSVRKVSRNVVLENHVGDDRDGDMVTLAQGEGLDFGDDPLGITYFAHRDGHVIGLSRVWHKKPKARSIMEKGSGEIYGLRWHLRPCGNRYPLFLVQQTYFLTAVTRYDGYRHVFLADESASGHSKKMKIGVVVRSTFVCRRPSKDHTLEHGKQNKKDDSVENTDWCTMSEQLEFSRRDPA